MELKGISIKGDRSPKLSSSKNPEKPGATSSESSFGRKNKRRKRKFEIFVE